MHNCFACFPRVKGYTTNEDIKKKNQSWILGCSEKLKNAKSNYGYSYFIAPWYIETEKI